MAGSFGGRSVNGFKRLAFTSSLLRHTRRRPNLLTMTMFDCKQESKNFSVVPVTPVRFLQSPMVDSCKGCFSSSKPIQRSYSTKAAVKATAKKARVARTEAITLDTIEEEFKEMDAARQMRKVQQEIPDVEQVIASDPSLQSPDYFQVHNLFTVRDLYDARIHMGHKVGSLDDRMKDFVFGSRFDCVLFDLDKTAFHLRQALNFAAHIAYRKGIILFVTRSPQAMQLVEKTAIECGEYAHCREWHTTVMTDSENKFGGITRLPDLIIFLNTLDTVMAPHGAIFDANKMLIPTIGIVDSNCDPNRITYPVPGNDDTISAIQFYCKVFKEAIMRGKQKRKIVENQRVGEGDANVIAGEESSS